MELGYLPYHQITVPEDLAGGYSVYPFQLKRIVDGYWNGILYFDSSIVGEIDNQPVHFVVTPPEHYTNPPDRVWAIQSMENNYYGEDSFSFLTYNDCPHSLNVYVSPRNDRPVLTAAVSSIEIDEDPVNPVEIGFTVTDVDDDLSLITCYLSDPPDHGTVVITDTCVQYMPHANYYGPDNFSWVAWDGEESVPAHVDIVIDSQPDTPVAENFGVATGEGVALEINLRDHATDGDNDPLEFSILENSGPYYGMLEQSLTDPAIYIYTPMNGFNGTDEFEYKASDESSFDNGKVTITVGVNCGWDPIVHVETPEANMSIPVGQPVCIKTFVRYPIVPEVPELPCAPEHPENKSQHVFFYIDGENYSIDDEDSTAPYQMQWTPRKTGSFTIRTMTVDEEGYDSDYDEISVTVTPFTAYLQAMAGDSSVLLSWQYEDSSHSLDPALFIADAYLTCSTNGNTVPTIEGLANSRWYRVGGLENGVTYDFVLHARDIWDNEICSSLVQCTPVPGSYPIYEVTSAQGFGGVNEAYLSWRLNDFNFDTTVMDLDIIGFLIHRDDGQNLELVAALPVVDQDNFLYTYTEEGLAPESLYTYTITTIDRLNRQSQGIELAVETVADGTISESLPYTAAIFTDGQIIPGITNPNQSWWGCTNLTTCNPNLDAISSVASGGLTHFTMGARDDSAHFFETLIPENEVFSVCYHLALVGDGNLFNDPITVLQFKNHTDNSVVYKVKIYQDSIYVGNRRGQYCHGSLPHEYTITRLYDDIHLYIDGEEITLVNDEQVNFEEINDDDAFVRFGAQSGNVNIITDCRANASKSLALLACIFRPNLLCVVLL
jgi:hypothetical protein